MQTWEFTLDNFAFASDRISSSQDGKLRDIARILLFGEDPVPPIASTDGVVVIGCGKGTNPEPHAVKRGVAVLGRLVDHLEAFGASEDDTFKVAWGGTETEVKRNGGVTGRDRKVRILVEWSEPEEPELPRPLTASEIRFFVWALTGEKPKRRFDLEAFLRFTDLQSFLSKPSNVSAALAWAKTYARVLKEEFKAQPERTLGAMIGASYSLLDAATDRRSRARPRAKTAAQRSFGEGFSWGYGEMRAHLARFPFRGKGRDEGQRVRELDLLLQRLGRTADAKSITGSSIPIGAIYRALHATTLPKLTTMKEQQYFASKSRGWFGYPGFKVKSNAWR